MGAFEPQHTCSNSKRSSGLFFYIELHGELMGGKGVVCRLKDEEEVNSLSFGSRSGSYVLNTYLANHT